MVEKTIRGDASVRSAQGFTLLELMTVVAILGILAMFAGPEMLHVYEKQETKATASQMAGLLVDARAHAMSEGTPYLVYFNAPSVDANGNCGAVAVEVKDIDHSYSLTPPDQTKNVYLPANTCNKVTQFNPSAAPAQLASVTMPSQDLAVRAPDAAQVGAVTERAASTTTTAVNTVAQATTTVTSTVAGVTGSGSGSGSSGSNSGSGSSSGSNSSGSGSSGSGSSGGSSSSTSSSTSSGESESDTEVPRSSTVAQTVVDGTTFPIDPNSGQPVVAFSERGIPVDPSDPSALGSGAGGIYLTDGDSTVTAAVVAPLGGVQVVTFDPGSDSWK